jgi:hypothetical protein
MPLYSLPDSSISAGVNTITRQYVAGGLAHFGMTSFNVFEDDFVDYLSVTKYGPSVTGSTTSAMQTGKRGGVMRLLTDSVAGHWWWLTNGNTHAPSIIANPKTEPWYVAWRGGTDLSIGSGQYAAVGLGQQTDGQKSILVGAAGHATKFACQTGGFWNTGGTITPSTIALDTSMHFFEMGSAGGGSVDFRVDGEAWITVALGGSDSSLGQYLTLILYNGAASAAVSCVIDWMIVAHAGS